MPKVVVSGAAPRLFAAPLSNVASGAAAEGPFGEFGDAFLGEFFSKPRFFPAFGDAGVLILPTGGDVVPPDGRGCEEDASPGPEDRRADFSCDVRAAFFGAAGEGLPGGESDRARFLFAASMLEVGRLYRYAGDDGGLEIGLDRCSTPNVRFV